MSGHLSVGQVQWHCSDEDSGPDVGILIGLGDGKSLWFGERLDSEGGGHGLIIYESNSKRVIDLSDFYELRDLFAEEIAPLLRRSQ